MTIRAVLLTFGLTVAVVQAQHPPQEAYPGQSQHREPPAGWVCYRHATLAKDKAHECQCHRMAHATPEDPICYEAPADPAKECQVWCWEKGHCLCDTFCDVGEHAAAMSPR